MTASNEIHFASDNYAGVHPAVLQAIADANGGHLVAYGEDTVTERLQEWARGVFGPQAQIFPVFNGTGANVVSLQSMTPRWGAVLAAATAHINEDEGGAPERVAGLKLLSLPTRDGRITPAQVASWPLEPGEVHHVQPQVVSISNSTELGTVYSAEEIGAIADAAHAKGMWLHLDGARIANAAAATGATLQELTAKVDVLSLGATKNGALAAEAVVVINPEAAVGVPFVRKFDMQLASKQRFLAAQILALYDGTLWLENARHANDLAARLADGLARNPGVEVPNATEANAVFAVLPEGVADRVRGSFRFYDWPAGVGMVRLMTAWDTPVEAVDELVATVEREMQARS